MYFGVYINYKSTYLTYHFVICRTKKWIRLKTKHILDHFNKKIQYDRNISAANYFCWVGNIIREKF